MNLLLTRHKSRRGTASRRNHGKVASEAALPGTVHWFIVLAAREGTMGREAPSPGLDCARFRIARGWKRTRPLAKRTAAGRPGRP